MAYRQRSREGGRSPDDEECGYTETDPEIMQLYGAEDAVVDILIRHVTGPGQAQGQPPAFGDRVSANQQYGA